MELKIRDGDYVRDGVGGLERVDGHEALVQRVLFKLTAHRGQFPFLEDLGSRLYTLGRIGRDQRQSAAEQAVTEALAGEKDLRVRAVELAGEDVRVLLDYEGEELDLRLTVR